MSIPLDDLIPGRLVTIREWHEEEAEPTDWNNPLAMMGMGAPSRSVRKTTGMGEIFRVVALSPPYVAMQDWRGRVEVYDLRELVLMRVTRGYAEAVLRARQKRETDSSMKMSGPTITFQSVFGNRP